MNTRDLFRTKKGIGGLSDNAISFVVVAVTLGIGATILANIRETQGADACTGFWNTTSQACEVSAGNTTVLSGNPASYNASTSGLNSLGTFSDNLGTLALVVIFGVILFFLGRFLTRRG